MLEFIKAPFMVLLYINELTHEGICNVTIYADHTTLCSQCDQASGVWQEVACWFQCWKNATGLYDRSNNTVPIDVKTDVSVLEEKSYFKILRFTFSSKLD